MTFVKIMHVDWSMMDHYQPSDFNHPEKLDQGVVYGLDRLANVLGKALVLSDWRIDSGILRSQHHDGRAIDFTYPGQPPMTVLMAIQGLRWFSGYGMYVNQAGVFSFHVDTRTDRTPQNPATWGASKHQGSGQKWDYVALRSIIDKYVVPATPALVWVGVMALASWYLYKHT